MVTFYDNVWTKWLLSMIMVTFYDNVWTKWLLSMIMDQMYGPNGYFL